MNSVVRVLIGDDHRIVREGLKQVLGDPANGAPEITVVAEATQGSEVLEQVTALQGSTGTLALDVVLLDIAMPGMDGLEVLQALRKAWPALPVLMLSTYPERQYAVRCIQMGAAGYLHKSADPDDMVAAVRKVASGGVFVTAMLAERVVQQLNGQSPVPDLQALTNRELDILQRIVSGQRPVDIADALHLSIKTVSTHKKRIQEKLKLDSTAALIRFGLEHRLGSEVIGTRPLRNRASGALAATCASFR